MTLRLGLLSTARINAQLVAGARESRLVDVVVAGSRDRNRAEAHARDLGVPRALGSYDEVLADPDVDAVYIPLPNSLHVEWSIRALEAGKHVLCEKPLSRRPEDVERAFDAAERNGRVLAEAFMWRHHPQAARLREAAAEIGPVRLVRGSFSFPIADTADVRMSADLDGGSLMDVGCYCVSAARLLLGEPESVAAQSVGDAVDEVFTGAMRFSGGALALFDCGFELARRDELEVVGREASLFLDDPWHSRNPVIEARGHKTRQLESATVDPYACELDDFARACAGEADHPFGRADAVGQARAIAALYQAADSGRAVTLNDPRRNE